MSANNEILISRKQNGLYKIEDVDTEEGEVNLLIDDDIDGLDRAADVANEYLQQCEEQGIPVEYGLRIIK